MFQQMQVPNIETNCIAISIIGPISKGICWQAIQSFKQVFVCKKICQFTQQSKCNAKSLINIFIKHDFLSSKHATFLQRKCRKNLIFYHRHTKIASEKQKQN